MLEIWPAVLVCGVSFAVPQYLISNFINPWIVDIGASLISMGCLIGVLRVWQPRELWLSPALRRSDDSAATMPPVSTAPAMRPTPSELRASITPWIIVCVILLVWGSGWFKGVVNPIFTGNYPVEGLHNMVTKVPPVVAQPRRRERGLRLSHLSSRSPVRGR